jgi:hypothetical protein
MWHGQGQVKFQVPARDQARARNVGGVVFTGFSDIDQGVWRATVQEVVKGRRGNGLYHIVCLHEDGSWRTLALHLSMVPLRQRTPTEAKKNRGERWDSRTAGLCYRRHPDGDPRHAMLTAKRLDHGDTRWEESIHVGGGEAMG